MKAIHTKYLGPTDTLGGRIKATADGWGSKTVNYDYGLNTDNAHFKAVKALIDSFDPKYVSDYPTVHGTLADGSMCWCYPESRIDESGKRS